MLASSLTAQPSQNLRHSRNNSSNLLETLPIWWQIPRNFSMYASRVLHKYSGANRTSTTKTPTETAAADPASLPRSPQMITLVSAIGECLSQLDKGNFADSLGVLDRFELGRLDSGDNDVVDDDDDDDADRISVASSSSSGAASFCDASSSPVWYDIESSQQVPPLRLQNPLQHTTESMVQGLRHLIERQEALLNMKAMYEGHLSLMAVHLQKQSDKLAELGCPMPGETESGTDAPVDVFVNSPMLPYNASVIESPRDLAQQGVDHQQPANTPRWWSTFLPAGGASPSPSEHSAAGRANWLPLAIALPHSITRKPCHNPPRYLCQRLPKTTHARVHPGVRACCQCCNNGDFSLRVQCSRCQTDEERAANDPAFPRRMAWLDLDRDATPPDGRPVTHTRRLAKRVNCMMSLLSFVTHQLFEVACNDGIRGKLGMQLISEGMSGTWLNLIKEVNMMSRIQTAQVRDITQVCNAVANGDLTRKVDIKGILGVSANVPGVNGVWKQLTDNVNNMADNITNQVRDISKVCKSVASGNLAQLVEVEAQGEMLELKTTINSMVTSIDGMAGGVHGMLGGQAIVPNVDGVWKDLTDNVNNMANNLTMQVRDITSVAKAVAAGDLTRKVISPLKGEMAELKSTINTLVDQLSMFAGEITRISYEVGWEGASALRRSMNNMAHNITHQLRTISEVTASVSEGDLGKVVDIHCQGEMEFLKNTINDMVGRLKTFSSEVSRVAKEVGTDGVLGGQAVVPDVEGIWKDLTDNVNKMANNLTIQLSTFAAEVSRVAKEVGTDGVLGGQAKMADNLTIQVRDIANVTKAISAGDLTQEVTSELNGEMGELKSTINTMVDQLSTFAAEVSRVAKEVGTDGVLGGQAKVDGVDGVWKDLTDNVNNMANNLTIQVRDIAAVTKAVAAGDLTQKVTSELKGEMEELKTTINTMVGQLSTFAAEVSRVAKEVGTDGVLGGQAKVVGVDGTWKDLTDNVNKMANNLTIQVRDIANVTKAISAGDLTQEVTSELNGEMGELKSTINTMVDQLSTFAAEVSRVAKEVGTDGILGGQAKVRDIANVTKAVAAGDLTQKVTSELNGEMEELKSTINTMPFADEVSRMAREVGTDGVLGGQAKVEGVGGVWKDLTDNVNKMADNLTLQVRDIANVTKAVAAAQHFAAEVSRVAKEVGTDGILGGQALVPNVDGVWKDLTDNVNKMANNLTIQVRDIAMVTKAVAAGDLTQQVTSELNGEMGELKTTINDMVGQLSIFAAEVSRMAREVGTDGVLGGQAKVEGVTMADNLTIQVRDIAMVTKAVAAGDLTQMVTSELNGEMGELKSTINTMVDQLSLFADEVSRMAREVDNVNKMADNLTSQVRDIAAVTKAVAAGNLNQKLSTFAAEVSRMAREVGTDGVLGGQAKVEGVDGVWKDLTDNVNNMANNLTLQVRDIANVTKAVAAGDLAQKVTSELNGEMGELKSTINTMVDQLSTFAAEVSRVAKEVGTDGILGGQAKVEGVDGVWKDLTNNVNKMANNLTLQVRDIANVTKAVAAGDLTQKVTSELNGEMEELKTTINTMVDQLSTFAAEVSRVAKEVGTDGVLGGQAKVVGVDGTWKGLTDNVNKMANNLTIQVRDIAMVTKAVAAGDLTQKVTSELNGEMEELKTTINTMVDQLSTFAAEVSRVAKEVGTDGVLGGQARVEGVDGTWKDLTENVNKMADNLTIQVRDIANVTKAVAAGDLAQKVTSELNGEMGELKSTINTMVDQLNTFAAEVSRVAKEVGTDGILGGQALVPNVDGVWKDLTDNVNKMANNLTIQVRDIAMVTKAVAAGDLTQQVTSELNGEMEELKSTINTMVDQLSTFAAEVSRMAREVGTDGVLGGQAKVVGVDGTWKDLTDNVNKMADNLTIQVRDIANVTKAVAAGDLTQKVTSELNGEMGELKSTINTMVDQLSTFAAEVSRVAKEVGTDGILGGQAKVEGVDGVWKDLTNNVNKMADNLTSQVRDIAAVTKAVAAGNLNQKVTSELNGEMGELKSTINTMVDQLSLFADEVSRVAKEVGTDGVLGGQANVDGVHGVWKVLTDNVNIMADNLTSQVRSIIKVTTAIAEGDLSKKVDVDVQGEMLDLKTTINDMVEKLREIVSEVSSVALQVGTDGVLGGQANLKNIGGTWKDLTDNVNNMANNLTSQVRDIANVTKAISAGDLNQKVTVILDGEMGELKQTINTMVDQLGTFASEVSRVAKEVGTDGVLGGQANVEGVDGIWKRLTDNVNTMADNLTSQVRSISEVTTAVAHGDLSKKIEVDVKGEMGALKQTINTMVDQLSTFAREIIRVALEVGINGVLGGQALVPNVDGVWKAVTENVNTMADNLTHQVRIISDVTKAVAAGDLTQKIEIDVQGEMLDLKSTINGMVDQLNTFAAEVSRVAKEVGTDGVLGGQAFVPNVDGTWKILTDNVNTMANNLTTQVRDIATVTKAISAGDLTQKVTSELNGDMGELKLTINTMVGQLSTFAAEVSRVAKEVGTDGVLGGQAQVVGVNGTWKDLTNNVNNMANNLTLQVRDIAMVTKAVAAGDLTQKVTSELNGEMEELKTTINTMVDQLSTFAAEVSRVAKEVGTDGVLGGQARVEGVDGTWKDLTENVNKMADNLTIQVRDIAMVTKAVAAGDLAQKVTSELNGEMGELKSTINTMVDQLSLFAAEVSRVAKEVGTDGVLGGQAKVEGVDGVWKDLTDNVNNMANNLTIQVRDIANVTKAVAAGDLTQKVTSELKGEMEELKTTINTMVGQLSTFAAEVSRVAKEVGTDGVLGGQAKVVGVDGTWKDLTDNVNNMANNLTIQVRDIANVTKAVAAGDLTQKVTSELNGEMGGLKSTINTMVDQLNTFAAEVSRVAKEVGTEGQLGGQAVVDGVDGVWKDLTDNVNKMADNLTIQVRDIANVTKAVAAGDLTQKVTSELNGEMEELKTTINTMVDQLSTFAAEVSLGTDGVLGGQAKVEGVDGVWKDLTDNVNKMADNLTIQVRDIANVTKAVAAGDLTQKVTSELNGEMEELKSTINTMVDQLSTFAAEVSRVAKEVGTDGILGGQAKVEGVDGVWKDLTDNVNNMANNLTIQVRDIANVTKAISAGDLKQKVTAILSGEMGELKSTINTMVDQLSTFAAEVSRVAKEVGTDGVLGGQAKVVGVDGVWKDLTDNVNNMANNLTIQVRDIANVTKAVAAGDLTQMVTSDLNGEMEELKSTINTMVGQLSTFAAEVSRVAKEVGTDGILGGQALVPNVDGVWKDLTDNVNKMADNLTKQVRDIAKVTKAISAGDLTQMVMAPLSGEMGELKTTINTMVGRLSRFAEELKKVAYDVGTRGKLGGQAHVVDIDGVWRDMTSKVNNMAHNLTNQVRAFAAITAAASTGDFSSFITIDAMGEMDALKSQINRMVKNLRESIERYVKARDIAEQANRAKSEFLANMSHESVQKGLSVNFQCDTGIPDNMVGDPNRIQQVLTNLVGNSVKFTSDGEISVNCFVHECVAETNGDNAILEISVRDTGIGIAKDKLSVIFDSFTQADGSTTRKYGGTGLGLSISKRLCQLHGGDIRVESVYGEGSNFIFTVKVGIFEPNFANCEKRILPYRNRNMLIIYDACQKPVESDDYRLRDMLKAFHLSTTVVESTESARHLFLRGSPGQRQFDTFIVDSLDTAEELRTSGLSNLSVMPIVYLVEPGVCNINVNRVIEHSITSYLDMPLDFGKLASAIVPALTLHSYVPDLKKHRKRPLHILWRRISRKPEAGATATSQVQPQD
ncbi:hypothetical protein BX661DRAFT_172824 [Kickxella alabastrina]|uniref:uncharacterized protein n=1 Tax=Kickxella alabastrina TaxID=61397 RepID=UPI00221FB0E4|nr:uncharacterized protein BX661DRAFT_172824 [Kickxella alabastrina]KAI7823072.1 hypothetical protein BX661DRAFT_172824 [Kickxella alabastrina]